MFLEEEMDSGRSSAVNVFWRAMQFLRFDSPQCLRQHMIDLNDFVKRVSAAEEKHHMRGCIWWLGIRLHQLRRMVRRFCWFSS